MIPFKKLEERRILLTFISSITFAILFTFSGNLVQSAYADFNFAAAGDWGCNSNTEATVSNMDAKDPERVFGLGDYSYESTGSCWFNRIGPIDSITKIAFGNHEDDDSEGFSGYMSHFGLSQTYYSFNYQDVHVLVMDTDRNSYSSGSAQRNFVQSDLQAASTNPSIKWIIVYLHKPMYTSDNECGSSSCQNTGSENTNLRNGFHPMFDQYGVDLVLQGHVHNYQRTFTLKYDSGSPSSPTITSNNANTYTEGNGAVFAIVGTGGVNFHALSGKASFTSSQQDDHFGQLDIKSTNSGNKLEGRFYRNSDNAVLDSFSISKAANSPPVANNQAVTVFKDTQKSISLTATDPNNNPLTYSIVTQPSHGTLSPTGTGGPGRTYTPAAGYTGPDSFTFRANDGVANSNTATVSINVIVQPNYKYAPGLVLTGSNFQDVASSPSLQLPQFSVAAWVKTSANFGSDAFIVNKGGIGSDSAGENMNYGIWMTSTEQIRGGFEAVGGADHFATSASTYNDGQWHYAIVQYDGITVRLYVDGVQVATKSTSGASPETSGTKPVRVGANSRVTPPTGFFTGEVDEVRVWSDDLTSSERANALAGTSFNTGEQVLHLPFGGTGGTYNYAPSLVLTGSNFHDVASTASLQLSQFSVAAWFKTSSNFGSDAFIVNKGGIDGDTTGQNMNYGIWMTSSETISAGFETSTGADQFATSAGTYNDGQWHYTIVQYDGITVRLYVDGVQVATKSTSGAAPETSGTKPVRVGANSRVTPPTGFFTGEVDEVRVWSDDLTSSERANAFAGTSFNTAEQRLYLDFSSAAASLYNYDPSLTLSGPPG